MLLSYTDFTLLNLLFAPLALNKHTCGNAKVLSCSVGKGSVIWLPEIKSRLEGHRLKKISEEIYLSQNIGLFKN